MRRVSTVTLDWSEIVDGYNSAQKLR